MLVLLVAACSAQPVEYPAGVSAAVCPNYPYCGNDANTLAAISLAQLAPTVRQYPSGVSTAACPGYPICDNAIVDGVPYTRQYPAGVSAATCPGYPIC